jgi:2-polyprenyl-3-methyl-5-hydroxy-6-metoxy-1,4-benzoquinol methylase
MNNQSRANAVVNSQRIHIKEAHFHDTWASQTDLARLEVRSAFEAPTAMENQFILQLLGPLSGKRVLDVGAGLGESSVYFALKGARVTCTDLSPVMVDSAVRLAHLNGVKIEGVVSAGEDLNVPAGQFDIAYIANTIHHVTDKNALFEQLRRALKPGGMFVSIDPLRYNPVIEAYRRMATEVRTEDEAPLGFETLKLVGKYFVDVQHREFWIASLALFVKYFAVDRIHPNQDRYWKRIFRERRESLGWWLPLRAVDRCLTRIPIVRRLAWNMVMSGRKP